MHTVIHMDSSIKISDHDTGVDTEWFLDQGGGRIERNNEELSG